MRAIFAQRAHRAPVLTRMLAPAPLGVGEDRWTQASTLDLDAHMHHRTVPEPGDMDALLATVLEVSKDPLDRSRPLWEVWYLTGLAGGAAALVLRTHHAVIDGIGTMQLLQVLFDTEPTPVDLDKVAQPVEGRPYPSLLRRALFEVPNRVATEVVTTGRIVKNVRAAVPRVMLGTPARVVGQAAPKLGGLLRLQQLPEPAHLPGYIPSPTAHPPVTVFNHRADNPRKSMAVISLPLQQIKQVRRGFPDVTVNDVLFALVTGALRDYLTDHDDLPDRPLRTTCPASIRVPGMPAGAGQPHHHYLGRPARAPARPGPAAARGQCQRHGGQGRPARVAGILAEPGRRGGPAAAGSGDGRDGFRRDAGLRPAPPHPEPDRVHGRRAC